MPFSFETILLSRPFKFFVGTEGVPVVVHEQAIADQSVALSVLMQGKMSESLAGEVTWQDVDQETFIRFTQFAYTGDYSVPAMIAKASFQGFRGYTGPQSEPVPESLEPEGWGYFSAKRDKKKRLSEPDRPSPMPRSTAFDSLTYPLLRPRSNFAHTCDPAMSEGSDENIGEVFLIHASLYVLAEKWGVDSLKRLTLFKLHKTLSMLELDEPKVTHIIKLARYAYSDENTPDLNNGTDGLRNMICKFAAANVKVLSEDPLFITMIEEGGVFIRDLWKCVVATYLTD